MNVGGGGGANIVVCGGGGISDREFPGSVVSGVSWTGVFSKELGITDRIVGIDMAAMRLWGWCCC